MSEELKQLRLKAEKRFKLIDPIKYMSRPKLFDVNHFKTRTEPVEDIQLKPERETLSGQYYSKRIDRLQALILHTQGKLNKHIEINKRRTDRL